MKIKLLHMTIVILLFLFFYTPLQAASKKVEGKVTGQVICLYHWKTDEAYQGSKAVCPNAGHDRYLITDKKEIYILEPADDASEEVKKLVRTNVFERQDIIAEGEIVKIGKNIKLIRVKGFQLK